MFLPNAQGSTEDPRLPCDLYGKQAPCFFRDNLSDILTEHAANSFLNRDSFNGKTHRKTASETQTGWGVRVPRFPVSDWRFFDAFFH